MNGRNARHRQGLRLMIVGLVVMFLISLVSLIRVWMALGGGSSSVFGFSVASLVLSATVGVALLVLAARSPRTGGLVNLVVSSGSLLIILINISLAQAVPVWWQLAGHTGAIVLLIAGSLLVYLSAGNQAAVEPETQA